MNKKMIHILGTRGIPAQHGGFETFAERLSIHLNRRGWQVNVYCQETGIGHIKESNWRGITLTQIPIARNGAIGTILFDWKAVRHALGQNGIFLTLGYNTACFNVLQRIKGQINVINMDGIEWKRDKWHWIAKSWFWLNERAGCFVGNHLVADHPAIKCHLASRVNPKKITMIPYGGDNVISADPSLLSKFGVKADSFSVIIARPEPENSILEMVRAFSRVRRNHKLIVLGNFTPEQNAFHRLVMESASNEVIFPGAIYDSATVQALRLFARFYLHGHRVGGTNPSLVEALGAGCAVIAHDNQFNRWVAGPTAAYFTDEEDCADIFKTLLNDDVTRKSMVNGSRQRFQAYFTWDRVLQEYEDLLTRWYPKS